MRFLLLLLCLGLVAATAPTFQDYLKSIKHAEAVRPALNGIKELHSRRMRIRQAGMPDPDINLPGCSAAATKFNDNKCEAALNIGDTPTQATLDGFCKSTCKPIIAEFFTSCYDSDKLSVDQLEVLDQLDGLLELMCLSDNNKYCFLEFTNNAATFERLYNSFDAQTGTTNSKDLDTVCTTCYSKLTTFLFEAKIISESDAFLYNSLCANLDGQYCVVEAQRITRLEASDPKKANDEGCKNRCFNLVIAAHVAQLPDENTRDNLLGDLYFGCTKNKNGDYCELIFDKAYDGSGADKACTSETTCDAGCKTALQKFSDTADCCIMDLSAYLQFKKQLNPSVPEWATASKEYDDAIALMKSQCSLTIAGNCPDVFSSNEEVAIELALKGISPEYYNANADKINKNLKNDAASGTGANAKGVAVSKARFTTFQGTTSAKVTIKIKGNSDADTRAIGEQLKNQIAAGGIALPNTQKAVAKDGRKVAVDAKKSAVATPAPKSTSGASSVAVSAFLVVAVAMLFAF